MSPVRVKNARFKVPNYLSSFPFDVIVHSHPKWARLETHNLNSLMMSNFKTTTNKHFVRRFRYKLTTSYPGSSFWRSYLEEPGYEVDKLILTNVWWKSPIVLLTSQLCMQNQVNWSNSHSKLPINMWVFYREIDREWSSQSNHSNCNSIIVRFHSIYW